jgi:hypothetical protein
MKKRTSSTTTSATSGATIVGKVDFDHATIELRLVEFVDRSLSILWSTESDKTEAPRASSIAIAHHD